MYRNRKTKSKIETISIMRENARKIAESIDSRGFNEHENIFLGRDLSELGELYQKGTIFYKEYKKGSVPTEEVLREDLSKMMDIYKDYVGDFMDTTTEAESTEKSGWE